MERKRCYGCMNLKSNRSVCEFCGYDETMQNEIHQLPAGTVLKEQYLIGKVLGQGGFGITYLGWDLYLDIPVAIKEYFPGGTVMRETFVSLEVVSYSGDAGIRFHNNKKRFLREAKMLARFSQVSEIVQVRNFFLANNTAYIVMEYVEGITLKQYIKEQGGKLSASRTFSLMEPVIKALDKVHKTGLVHRDISPDNIMMTPEGKIKLLDFGAVRDVGDADVNQPLTRSTEAILKQGFAPIEQYQNRGSLGPWTDVYALCATIYFCMTGHVPPDAPARLLDDEEVDFRSLESELTDYQIKALEKGLELRAQARFSSMDQLYKALYEAAEENVVTEIVANISSQEEELPVTVMVDKEVENSLKEQPNSKLMKSQKRAIFIMALVIFCYGIGFAFAFGDSFPGLFGNYRAQGECGDGLKWYLEDDGTFYLRGEGYTDDYNGCWMTENDEGYNPDASMPPWSVHMDKIQKLVVDEDVTAIGAYAFSGAVNLTEVEWNSDLNEIAQMAFENTGMESLNLPDSIEEIGQFAFANCQNLKNVDLPYRLAELQAGTFMNCHELENIVIRPYTYVGTGEDEKGKQYHPFSLLDEESGKYYTNGDITLHTYEEAQAREFADKYGIYYEFIHGGRCGDDIEWEFDSTSNTLYLSGSGNSWYYCLDEEQIEERAMEVARTQLFLEYPDWTYSFREDIESVVVGDEIGNLNSFIFTDLYNLKNVDLGTGVSSLDFAFYDCTNLEEIVIPENVGSIGSYSFESCESLRKVTFEGEEAMICDGTFSNAVNLEEIHCSKGMSIGGADRSPFDNPYTDDDKWSKDVVLYVYEGSEMHEFAVENGFNYEIVE